MMSFFLFRGDGADAKLRERFNPGASDFGARFIFSIQRAQAATSVFPVGTRLTPTFTAPQSSHSPMEMNSWSRSLNPLLSSTAGANHTDLIHSRLLVELIDMGTDVERTDGKMPNNADDDLRSLEEAYSDLREETQQLINERTSLKLKCVRFARKLSALKKTSTC